MNDTAERSMSTPNASVAIDSLRLHPDAEKVPMPDADDLRNLRSSLRENGQQDPIDVTADALILDGRTRWSLLRELGAQSIQVRVVDIPVAQQTTYIVDRAVARRQLTPAQKRALNDLLRVQVIEVRPSKTSGQPSTEMRIGLSQTERAATLGVERETVKRWDAEVLVGTNVPTRPTPTHAVDGRGRPQPIHKGDPRRVPKPVREAKPHPPRAKRVAPPWLRHYTLWCRAVLPEDRATLVRMSKELHDALRQIGASCNTTEGGTE